MLLSAWFSNASRFTSSYGLSQKVLARGFQEILTFSEMSFENTTKVYLRYSKPSQGEGTQSMKALKATSEMQGRLVEVMFISWCKGCLRTSAGL